jgi:SAM-dependent methyltransferase
LRLDDSEIAFFPARPRFNLGGIIGLEVVMSRINDQDYLCNEQYKNARNINARIRMHVEFSTNKYGWFRWVFDQYEIAPQARILELGCGPGDLWLENIDRIPEGWEITLSDFSPGMLTKAQEKLVSQHHPFTFKVIDAQSIPYEADHFDVVIANHFLYHVPDRPKAIAEIRRVLKPGGPLYTTTIGMDHMKELPDLVERFDPENGGFLRNTEVPFTLEDGTEQLRTQFSAIEMRRYEDELRVTDADVMVDYAFSGMRLGLARSRRDEFYRYIEQEMAANDGVIVIKKDSGIFLAR